MLCTTRSGFWPHQVSGILSERSFSFSGKNVPTCFRVALNPHVPPLRGVKRCPATSRVADCAPFQHTWAGTYGPSTPSSSLWCSSATLRRRLRLLRALLTGPYDLAKNFKVTHTFEPYEPNAENDVDMMYVGVWHTLHEAHVLLSELSS